MVQNCTTEKMGKRQGATDENDTNPCVFPWKRPAGTDKTDENPFSSFSSVGDGAFSENAAQFTVPAKKVGIGIDSLTNHCDESRSLSAVPAAFSIPASSFGGSDGRARALPVHASGSRSVNPSESPPLFDSGCGGFSKPNRLEAAMADSVCTRTSAQSPDTIFDKWAREGYEARAAARAAQSASHAAEPGDLSPKNGEKSQPWTPAHHVKDGITKPVHLLALGHGEHGPCARFEFPGGWERTIDLPTQADAYHPLFDGLAWEQRQELHRHVQPAAVASHDGVRKVHSPLSFTTSLADNPVFHQPADPGEVMSWADRAKARFPDNRPVGTDKTAKTPLSSVSSVRPGRFQESTPGVSSVLSVGGASLFKNEAANETFPEDHLLAELITASMLACIHHADGPEAREAMRADCLATPPHQRADLLAHFRQAYGRRA